MLTVRDSKPMPAKSRVIFFICDCAPSKEELAECESLERPKRHIVYRNAKYIGPKDSLEACDAVAGCVPPSYSHLPVATADGIRRAELKPLSSDPNNEEEQQGIAALAEYSVAAVLAMVARKEIPVAQAMDLERKGRNRPTLIEALSKL